MITVKPIEDNIRKEQLLPNIIALQTTALSW